jgi:hypothetical protein
MSVIAEVLFSEALDKNISNSTLVIQHWLCCFYISFLSFKKLNKSFPFLPERKTALLKPIVSPPAIF